MCRVCGVECVCVYVECMRSACVYGECVCVVCVWCVECVCACGVYAESACMHVVCGGVCGVVCGVWRCGWYVEGYVVCGVCGVECEGVCWCMGVGVGVEVCAVCGVESVCVECMCVCVRSVHASVIKNRQVFPWDPLQSTPGDRLHTQVFPGIAHHRGQTTQRVLPLASLLGYQGALFVRIYIHDSICVSVHAYVSGCVVFQCTHMVVCMIDKPSPGTLLKASTQ